MILYFIYSLRLLMFITTSMKRSMKKEKKKNKRLPWSRAKTPYECFDCKAQKAIHFAPMLVNPNNINETGAWRRRGRRTRDWKSETSWVTTKHLGGPGHTSDGAFLPAKILSKTIDFERPGGPEWLPSGTPFQKFYTFFGRFFGPACLRPRYVKSLRRGFFCNVKKVCSKDPIRYVGWGFLGDPLF